MASDSSGWGAGDLRRVAAITAVVVGTVAVAGLAYLLLDILLCIGPGFLDTSFGYEIGDTGADPTR